MKTPELGKVIPFTRKEKLTSGEILERAQRATGDAKADINALVQAAEAVKDLPPGHPERTKIDAALEKKSIELGGDAQLPFEQRMMQLRNVAIHKHAEAFDPRYRTMTKSAESYQEATKTLTELLQLVERSIAEVSDIDYKKDGVTEIKDFWEKKEFRSTIQKIDALRIQLAGQGINFDTKGRLSRLAPKNEWYVTHFVKRVATTIRGGSTREAQDRSFQSAILGKMDIFNISGAGKREALKGRLEALSSEIHGELHKLTAERGAVIGNMQDYYKETAQIVAANSATTQIAA